MDKRRQELEELQDDIHLALLMDEYADSMGAEIRAEAEKAFETGEITIPQEVDDACVSILGQSSKIDKRNKSTRTLIRYCLVAAATVVILLGSMVIAQAAGFNVFGKLASWTDSVFHYGKKETTITNTDDYPLADVRSALSELGIPVELAPSRLPDGFLVTSIKPLETNDMKLLTIVVEKEGKRSQILIEEYTDTGLIDNARWEKTDQSAIVFSSNDREFYLIENQQGWSGTWSDGRYNISLFGIKSFEDLKYIIQSIGVKQQ